MYWNYPCHLGVNLEKKRTLTKKDSRGLTGHKFSKSEPCSHFCTGSRANCTSRRNLCWTACPWTELSACLCGFFAIWARPYKGFLDSCPKPVWLRLFSFKGSCSHPTSQRDSILTNQNNVFGTIKLWGLRVLICMRMEPWGTKDGDFCPYKPASLWFQSALSLPTKDWRLCVPGRAETPKLSPQIEWSRPVWSNPTQCCAKPRAEQSGLAR